jgi:hypothetical protein
VTLDQKVFQTSSMRQPTFFDKSTTEGQPDVERLVLRALGDFQARGKVLADRDLPLDRLRGALRRASEAFGVDELDDEQAAAAFTSLGARVRRVPSFFAKHPYRVIVPTELAERARAFFGESHTREG